MRETGRNCFRLRIITMKKQLSYILFIVLAFFNTALFAQQPVVANPDHEAMLQSDDPRLAANKRLVYDMWRTLLDAGHAEQADKFLAEDYIQHNPNVATGRAAVIEFIKSSRPRTEIPERVNREIVSITAEGDYVIISFVRRGKNPLKNNEDYTTSWFDMFRIENGKIAEHWDTAELWTEPPKF